MARRGGFFSRIVGAIRDAFTREELPRRAPVSPQEPPERPSRQRRRERNYYLDTWRGNTSGHTGYLTHKDIIDDLALEYNLDEEDKQELWDDYTQAMVGRRGTRLPYRYNDVNNPFWNKWGIDPDNFDWQRWRETMGDSPRRR